MYRVSASAIIATVLSLSPAVGAQSLETSPSPADTAAAGAALQSNPAPPPASASTAAPEPEILIVDEKGNITRGGDVEEDVEGVYHYDGLTDAPERDSLSRVAGGPVPEIHVVRQGDTLWDICGLYFNNPWEWPRIWSYNPTVTNPHWIYPGDLVRLYPKGDTPATVSAADPDPIAVSVDAPTQATQTSFSLRQLAYIDAEEFENKITIVGSVDEKSLLAEGDSVYLEYEEGKPPKVGETYSVYDDIEEIVHPKTGKVIGAYVTVMGALKVRSVKKDKKARAVLIDSDDAIERGRRVGPAKRVFKDVPPTTNESDATGNIVASLGYDQLIGATQVVIIDIGTESGLKNGNRLYAIRRGDAYRKVFGPGGQVGQDDKAFPARALGELLVVDAGKNTSLCLVTFSVQELGVGEMVLMRKGR